MEYGWETMERREISRLRVLTPSASRGFECNGLLTTCSAWEATISCDGLLCSFDIHVGL
jgi:hypothetical protein